MSDRAIIKAVIATIFCIVWPACPCAAQQPAEDVDRQPLETITRKLASPEFNGRSFNAEGGRKAAAYIGGLFRDIGLKFAGDRSKPASESGSHLRSIPGSGMLNVIGIIEGRDEKLRNEFVIVSAHYDGFGDGFPGAMDNAAGVAVMAEIARSLAKNPPQRSLLFIAFAGGEQNDAGAKYYAEHPVVPLEQTAAMINLSGFGGGMSGQLLDTLYVAGAEYSPQLREAIGKHKRGEARLALARLALVGRDAMRWPGGEHLLFSLKQVPTMAVTNGVHYAYHSKADTPDRIDFAALEKHAAALVEVAAGIANAPGRIEMQSEPSFDADEAMEWHRVLTALRENIIKTPGNDDAQSQIDDALLELKRHKDRPVQDPKAREAVILRAANLCFFIANPNGVEYNSLLNRARNHEDRGERLQAIDAYRKLLKFIEEEHRHDDRTVGEIRKRLARLEQHGSN
jgi:hypothetical protein